jgi:hypothetical protein
MNINNVCADIVNCELVLEFYFGLFTLKESHILDLIFLDLQILFWVESVKKFPQIVPKNTENWLKSVGLMI